VAKNCFWGGGVSVGSRFGLGYLVREGVVSPLMGAYFWHVIGGCGGNIIALCEDRFLREAFTCGLAEFIPWNIKVVSIGRSEETVCTIKKHPMWKSLFTKETISLREILKFAIYSTGASQYIVVNCETIEELLLAFDAAARGHKLLVSLGTDDLGKIFSLNPSLLPKLPANAVL